MCLCVRSLYIWLTNYLARVETKLNLLRAPNWRCSKNLFVWLLINDKFGLKKIYVRIFK